MNRALTLLSPIALLSVITSAPLPAQGSIAVPVTGPSQGACNAIPFGVRTPTEWPENQRYQTLLTPQQLGTLPRGYIREIAFAPCYDGVHRFGSLTIRMSQTQKQKLTTTFAANLGPNPVTVLQSRDFYWHYRKGAWSPIGLQLPFKFTAGQSLIIDVEVTRGRFLAPDFQPSVKDSGRFRRGDDIQRLYAVGWKTQPPATGVLSPAGLRVRVSSRLSALGIFGIGCAGTGKQMPELDLSGSATPGGTTTSTLSRGISNAPTLMILGLNSRLPFPLVLPFNGCRLYHTLDANAAMMSDASGRAAVPIPLPNLPQLIGQKFYTQFFQFEFSPAIGLRASPYGRVLIG